MANTKLPPTPVGVPPGHSYWNDWYERLRNLVNNTLINHNDLQNIQGGSAAERYHLTNTQQLDLTDGGDSALHFHSADRARANHTGTQTLSTISDVTITAANLNSLDDGVDSSLHFHASDRARANHTGTQDHNTTLSGLQGGTAGQYYHLTSAEYTGTGTGNFVRESSPALVGTPTAPTAAAGTNTTQVATTAHVFAERSNSFTLTNKTIALGSNTVSGTTAQFNTSLTDGDFATLAGTETLTNKTINLSSNTLVTTSAQLAAALTDETGSGAAVFATSPTLTTPKATTTLGVGNATPSASGSGISFPATQSASTDANTLDDYEEGTFTPRIDGTTTAGVGTYTTQIGRYRKIGDVVYFIISLTWTAHTGTGNMNVHGLPFTSANVSGLDCALSWFFDNIALTAGNFPEADVRSNATTINLRQIPTGGGAQTSITLDTAGTVKLSGFYLT